MRKQANSLTAKFLSTLAVYLIIPHFALVHAAQANPFVDLNLEVGMKVSASGTHYHETGTLNCNPVGKDRTSETVWAPDRDLRSSKGNGRFESSIVTQYVLAVNYADGHWMQPRKLTTAIEIKPFADGGFEVRVKIDEKQTRSVDSDTPGQCGHTAWTAVASNDFINGSIKIGYRLPQNAWAVKVKRVQREGVFAVKRGNAGLNSIMAGVLNSKTGVRSRSEFTAWGRPGSDISEDIGFDFFSSGEGVKGEIVIQFTPKLSPEILVLSDDSIAPTFGRDLAVLDTRKDNTEFLNKFVIQSLTLVSDQARLKRFVGSLSTKALFDLANSLSAFANKDVAKGDYWDARAAASILGYEIALQTLDELKPYCEMNTVELPFSGTKVNILGLKMAHLYLKRAQLRVENYRFSHYRALVEQMASYQKQNLTYSSIRSNQAEMAKLQKAYQLLKTAVGDGITPFGAALTEVNFVLSKFRSIGAGESATDQVLQSLSQLSVQEKQFISQFVLRLRQFGMAKQEVVKADDLLAMLNDIEMKQEVLAHQFRTNLRLLSSESGEEISGFSAMMENLISNNIAIFNKELKNTGFEEIRKVYRQEERSAQILKQADACILERL